MIRRLLLLTLAPLLLTSFVATTWADTALPKKKRTSLGLYITAQEAFRKWDSEQDAIKILDVRTPGEYVFVGHANMATNIPLKLYKDKIDAKTMKPVMPINGNFVTEVKKRFDKSDTIMIMCRSGSRSAVAVNTLAKAGFKNVFNITDGFEGDKSREGKRVVNGWKNSGAPWTYKLDPKLAYLP
jgi:rhodanese-related sulfurtransferase